MPNGSSWANRSTSPSGKTPDLRVAYVDLDSRVLLNRGTDLKVNKVYETKNVKGLEKGLAGKSEFIWLREGPRLVARNVMPLMTATGSWPDFSLWNKR